MIKYCALILILLSSLSAKSQTNPKETQSDTLIFNTVDHPPEFPGGLSKFNTYLAKNITYPKEALNDVQGSVIAQMIIEKNGSISNVRLLKVKSKALRKEITSVLLNSPKWKPGILHNKPVRVNYTILIACMMPTVE